MPRMKRKDKRALPRKGILITEKPGKGSKRQDYGYYSYNKPRKKQPMWREVRQNTFVPTGQLSVTIVTRGSNRDGRPKMPSSKRVRVWGIFVCCLALARRARVAPGPAVRR